MPTAPSNAADDGTDAVERIAFALRDLPGALLPILHAVQAEAGYISSQAIVSIAAVLNLSRAEVHGVVSYYHHFRTTPPGRHVVEVCRAESCQAMGSDALAEHVESKLRCRFHATSDDGSVSLEPVYCLGLCAQSPAIAIDGRPHARITPERFDRLIARCIESAELAS
jgi:formate dehydrogenase subunit gamma